MAQQGTAFRHTHTHTHTHTRAHTHCCDCCEWLL